MPADDGRDSEADAPQGERDAVLPASPETRAPTVEDAAELESRLVAGEEESAAAGKSSDAEVVFVEAEPAKDDDRTQLVMRGITAIAEGSESGGEPSGSEGSGDALVSSTKPTRVLDPAVVPADPNEVGVPPLAGTRALEYLDKTVPLPLGVPDSASEAVATPQAPPAAPPAHPPSGDSERGLTPGTILFGEYEIVNVLGVGGMGEVYRARHRRLEEYRAIKVMHAELSKKKGASEFFYREAKALLAVRHPAVVHCHDLLSDDAGRVYLIMEMIEGIPLSKKIDEGPLSPDDVAILGARVSQGLSAAHHKGVIHRDVSPDNIVLPNGRVQEAKIIDFGIAKLLEDGEGTIVEGFKGKLSYASPEQLGFFGGKIDGQSDFYSLGLVLVAAAQGRPMGMGTTVVEAVDARRSFETLPDEIPVGLRSAIQPLLALDPDDRPRYVDRLFVVPGAGEGRKGTGPIPDDAIARSRGTKAKSGNRIGPIAGGAVAAALLVGGGLYLGWSGTGTTEAKAPTVVVDSATTGAEPGALDLETPGREQGGLEEDLPTVDETGLDTSAPMPERPTPRRLSAGDRIKIIGLINNAKLALEENRLMSPANDNAYDRYRRVLTLDPNEERAKNGLREVASRYVRLAGQALDKGDLEGARTFVDRAKRADATQPGIASLESRIDH